MKRSMLLSLTLAVLLAGCGGPEVTFWLITTDPSGDPVCVPAPTMKPTQTDTQTGFLQSSTWELYPGKDASGKDNSVLQPSGQGGAQALACTQDGGKYTCTGVDTRVTYSPTQEMPTRTETDTTTTTVTFTIDGSTLSGTAVEAVTHGCTGTNCPMQMNPAPCSQSSTTTTTFRGTKVDAEIRHNV